MKSILSKREREELKSLKNDLVNPVKRFVGEVYTDTVGDAKSFYSKQAKQAQQTAKRVQQRTEEKMAVVAQKREEQQKQRKASLKWLAITLVLILVLGVVFVSAALSARAEGTKAPQRTASTAYTDAVESDGAPVQDGVIPAEAPAP